MTHAEAPTTAIAYTDADVVVNARDDAAEAILVRDGRIDAIGSNETVLRAAGAHVQRQSLDGLTVIPGLIDTHPHLLTFATMKAPLLDITDARNHEDILAAIGKRASETPKGDWILTTPVGEPHYFHRRSYRDLAEGMLPDRHLLDRVAPDHLVFIQAWGPTTPNVCTMNSAALAALEIDSATPDRVWNVWIEKDGEGVPTGVLRGSVNTCYNADPFFGGLAERMPPIIDLGTVTPAITIEAMSEYNALGITTIFEGHAMDFEDIEHYRELRQARRLSLRVHATPELELNAFPGDSPRSLREIRERLETALSLVTMDDEWMRVDGISATPFGIDQPWHGGYKTPWGETTIGQRSISTDKMRLAFDFCAEHGLRLNLGSCSPDEHEWNLKMTAETLRKHQLDRAPWIIQHGLVIHPSQAKRYADLGFAMTVCMGFTFGEGDALGEQIGDRALDHLNPLRTLLDSGLTVSASSDWGPLNPFEHMQLALTHKMYPSGRSNAGPGKVITRAEAFEMWTANGAKVLGWEGVGDLSSGNHADLAIVDRNPITCELDALPATRVVRTMVGGQIVYDDASLPPSPAMEPSSPARA